MKKILAFITLIVSNSITAQNCPEPSLELYKKVMNSAFAKNYENCPAIIEAEYFGDGYMKSYRKPARIKNELFFQCVEIGGEGKSNQLGSIYGDFFVIEPSKGESLLTISKGTKLRLTGTTFTQNYAGVELSTFFIVDSFEIIPE